MNEAWHEVFLLLICCMTGYQLRIWPNGWHQIHPFTRLPWTTGLRFHYSWRCFIYAAGDSSAEDRMGYLVIYGVFLVKIVESTENDLKIL
jgi:hypothetical protein